MLPNLNYLVPKHSYLLSLGSAALPAMCLDHTKVVHAPCHEVADLEALTRYLCVIRSLTIFSLLIPGLYRCITNCRLEARTSLL